MPVELTDLLQGERWIPVTMGAATFNVAYRPGNTSLKRQAELQRKMREMQGTPDLDEVAQADEIGRVFCEMICAWDLVRQGVPLPVTPQVVTDVLPAPVFNAIMAAISADAESEQEQKKISSARSGAGLPQTTRRENVPNGTPSSGRPSTWA